MKTNIKSKISKSHNKTLQQSTAIASKWGPTCNTQNSAEERAKITIKHYYFVYNFTKPHKKITLSKKVNYEPILSDGITDIIFQM